MTPSQELVDALAALERGNQPWCPDARFVRRAIVDRTKALSMSIWQLVRLVRLGALASKSTYVEFFYGLDFLHRDQFVAAIVRARDSGLLSPGMVEVGENSIRMLEKSMAQTEGLAFELFYSQMPRITGLLDVLHNTLGFNAVEELLKPLLTRGEAKEHADSVATGLRTRFNAYLKEALESAHRRSQFRCMQEFMAGYQRPMPDGISLANTVKTDELREITPQEIDDTVLFEFWRSRAAFWHHKLIGAKETGNAAALAAVQKESADEGFRRYRSAVRHMLRYQRALRDNNVHQVNVDEADHVLNARSASEWTKDRSVEWQTAGYAALPFETKSDWENPVVALSRFPCNRVKWLTDKERARLQNVYGRPARELGSEAEDEDANAQSDHGEVVAGALIPGEPYDFSFLWTLLRVDVFDPVQGRIISRLKRGDVPNQAIRAGLELARDEAYGDARRDYLKIRDTLVKEAFAAFFILIRRNDVVALTLLAAIAEETHLTALRELLPDVRTEAVSGEALETLAQTMSGFAGGKQVISGALVQLFSQASAACKGVNREGFQQAAENPEIREALGIGCPHAVNLIDFLKRLVRRLDHDACLSEVAADRARFEAVFHLLYNPKME